MDREMMGQVLDDLMPGDSTEIDEVTLGMLFPPGEAASVIDERTRTAATRFARDHGCRFLFEGQSSRSTFLKLPGRWRDSSNKKVWTEALHLLDNPRVRVPSYERPKDSPKR
jgi:hypothetical protein